VIVGFAPPKPPLVFAAARVPAGLRSLQRCVTRAQSGHSVLSKDAERDGT